MTDFMYANKGGGGIFRKGQLGPIGQGTVGIDLVIDIFDLAQAPIDLTGYTTITGRMKKQDTGAVTAIDGTRTLVGTGSTGKFTWVVSANDSGTDGLFDVVFNLSNGTDTIVTLPGELLITNNPSVTASANNLLIGILQATSDWLTAEKTAIESAADGEILQSDGTNSEGSGITAVELNAVLGTGGTDNFVWTADAVGGAGWEAAAGGVAGIDDLTDVTIDGTPADNEVLAYNTGTSQWINQTAAEAGLSATGHTHGATAWGAITGTLADQTDLQTALDAKATTAALSAHESDTTNIHGIADTSVLATATDLSNHAADTTAIHGIADTSALLDTADIGVSVQAFDAGLSDLAGLAVTDGNFIVGNGTNWIAESGATARESLFGVAFSVTGTGALVFTGGATLTVPATGTAVLLSETQTITGNKSFTGELSSPGAGVASTKLGAGAASAGTSATAIGGGATASGNFSTAIGKDAIANQTSSIAIGLSAISNIANTMVIGADGRVITHSYIGAGITTTAPIASTTITTTGGTGTNIAATALHLAGGRGTGTGAGGSINLQTAPIGASGSSQNALVTAAEIDDQPTGAEETRLLLLDLSDGTLKRVVFGADGSGGAGLKLLAVAN